MIDLRCGDWREVLADVGEVDAVICDPPYGARTHDGNADVKRRDMPGHSYQQSINYAHWSASDVGEFVNHWSARCNGWMVCMTSDDLIPVWRDAYSDAKRLDFAPVPFLQHRPRVVGDGPGSGAVYLMVARPKGKRFATWGSLPCWYGPVYTPGSVTSPHIGGKPLSIMLEIVRDYTRPGDLVADPTAGGATTLIAAHTLGRRAIGAEMDPATYAKAQARIDRHLRQGTLFEPALMATQTRMEV